MAAPQVWSKVSEKFAYDLGAADQQVQLYKVTGMSLTLKGKVRKVLRRR